MKQISGACSGGGALDGRVFVTFWDGMESASTIRCCLRSLMNLIACTEVSDEQVSTTSAV